VNKGARVVERAAASGWFKATLGALLGALVGAGMAGAQSAAVPTVHACVTNTSGAVRILTDPTGYSNPSQACPAGGADHVLDWNQTGPAGSQGAAGPAGAAGRFDPATADALARQIGAVAAGADSLVADQAAGQRQDDALRRRQELFGATHVPDYAIVLRRVSRLLGPGAAQQLLAPGIPLPRGSRSWSFGTTVGASNDVAALRNDLDSLSEMGETESLRLQMAMDRLSKLMTTVSNLLKKIAETDGQILQNIK